MPALTLALIRMRPGSRVLVGNQVCVVCRSLLIYTQAKSVSQMPKGNHSCLRIEFIPVMSGVTILLAQFPESQDIHLP